MRTHVLLGVLTPLVALLVACGGGSGDAGGFGVYETSGDGARFTFTIPAPSDEAAVIQLEEYRVAVGAPPVSYILASGSNEGDEEKTIPTVSIVTDEGATIDTVIAWSKVGDWQNRVNILSEGDLYNQGVSLYNHYLSSDDLLPGAVSGTVLISDEPIHSVKSVFVERNLFDALEAFTEAGGRPKPLRAKKVSSATSP